MWIKGVASESNPRSPSVPGSLLAVATVTQTWRPDRPVSTDGVRVVPFSDIEALNNRLDYVMQEVARQRLEADVFTRESGARVGLFVDPLLGDDMRDQGIEQTAAVVDGELTLPVAARAYALSRDVALPTARAYTPEVVLEQKLRTGSMAVNPYMSFEPLPARVTMTPAVDRWTDVQTQWTSAITQHFDVTRDGYFHIVTGQTSTTTTNVVSQTSRELEYLRQIEVQFRLEGFGPGEILRNVTFDGIPVEFRE